MSDREKNKEKPSETGSSQQDSANNNPAKPQGYGTVPLQKSYAENEKNSITIEQPLNKDK